MPSFIQGYENDIFISYRQKDNKYDGWVTEFVENLKRELESTFKEEISVYFDVNPHDGLLETHDVDASLKEKLKCLIFIPIISRTYCDPKAFAWEHEFKAFVDQASKDQYGLKVRLPNGNVANRVLPIVIYDLDKQDIAQYESTLQSVLRGIEFIYKEPGVNRPLKPDDDEKVNLNKTKYRNQINKVGNAIKEIVSGIRSEPNGLDNEKIQYVGPWEEIKKKDRKGIQVKPAKSFKWNLSSAIAIITIIVIAGVIFYAKYFGGTIKPDVEKSLAVMTFRNLTGDSSNNYLAEMQREALYHELGKIGQVKPLRIVGSYTTSVFEKNRATISETARDANVEYIVEGSLLSTGLAEEILVRLIQVLPEEKLIWDGNYTNDRKNIFRLYNNVAGQIVQKIGLELLPQDEVKLPQPPQVNPQSYEAYSRGMAELEKSTAEGVQKGLEYLHEAVDIAPEDPFANAGLAIGYFTIAHSPLDPGDALAKMEEYAYKAVSLDSTLALAHLVLGLEDLYVSWNFEDAEKQLKKTLELEPNLDIAHYQYAWALCLWGHLDEAIAEHKIAQKIDPYNPLHTAWLGDLYIRVGRYDDAIETAEEAFKLEKDYSVGYSVLVGAYMGKGLTDSAIATAIKLVELYPENIGVLGSVYAKTGHREEAEKILHEIESQPIGPWVAANLANLNAVLGNADEAFKWLAYEPHHAWIPWAAVNEDFESLHSDPRWQEFLDRLNLP